MPHCLTLTLQIFSLLFFQLLPVQPIIVNYKNFQTTPLYQTCEVKDYETEGYLQGITVKVIIGSWIVLNTVGA
jgi:hypothetical protein